mgnify:CR=1 FL=1
MQKITLTFDRVFDVVHHDYGDFLISNHNDVSTSFSFSSNGKREFSVTLPGRHDFVAGVTVTAVLMRAGDWQTIIGLVDHTSGKIIIEKHHNFVENFIGIFIGACMFTGLSLIFTGAGRWFSAAGAAIGYIAVGAGLIGYIRYRRVIKILIECKNELIPNLQLDADEPARRSI